GAHRAGRLHPRVLEGGGETREAASPRFASGPRAGRDPRKAQARLYAASRTMAERKNGEPPGRSRAPRELVRFRLSRHRGTPADLGRPAPRGSVPHAASLGHSGPGILGPAVSVGLSRRPASDPEPRTPSQTPFLSRPC